MDYFIMKIEQRCLSNFINLQFNLCCTPYPLSIPHINFAPSLDLPQRFSLFPALIGVNASYPSFILGICLFIINKTSQRTTAQDNTSHGVIYHFVLKELLLSNVGFSADWTELKWLS